MELLSSGSRPRSSVPAASRSGPSRPAAIRGFAGGLASMFCQGLVLRESLYARHEAELAAGLALAAWLLASGLGGLLAARAAGSRAWWASTIALLGLVAPAAAWLCRAHAIDPALASSVSGLLAGAAFAMPFGKGAGIAAVCAAEAAGALLGGVLFSALSASMLLGGLALSAVVLSMGAAAVSGGIPAALALLAATAAVFAGLPGRLDRLAVIGGPAASCDSFTTRPGARGEVVVSWRSGQATLWRSGRVEGYQSAPEAAELLSIVPLAYSGEGRIRTAPPAPSWKRPPRARAASWETREGQWRTRSASTGWSSSMRDYP
jgi:hypothetical protein